jgi:hypothetical protein
MKISGTTRQNSNYSIALMGLSGVGKTTLARRLPSESWFHYSVDYRIWTHYLGDELDDYLKKLAMTHPILREMLKKDAITVKHRVHLDNLVATSLFMGMLGNPDQYGSAEADFRGRMQQHSIAEKAAMEDIPRFKKRAAYLYQYPHFLVDTGGSLCEIVTPDDPNDPVLKLLDRTCDLVYIRATKEHKQELLRRALADPKPIYYRPDFLDENIPGLLKHFKAKNVTDIDPKDVAGYLYPRLLDHRIARYEAIARQQGYTLEMNEVFGIQTEDDLITALRKHD